MPTNHKKPTIPVQSKRSKDDLSRAGLKKPNPTAPTARRPKAHSEHTDPIVARTPQVKKQKALLIDKKPVPSVIQIQKPVLDAQKVLEPKFTEYRKAEETKYEEMPDKVDVNDLEVFSDYSYSGEEDIDRPENTKSITCGIELIKKVDGSREMIIRKKYFLEDGRELRVKNIKPVKDREAKQ
jgi:hypothetical protein